MARETKGPLKRVKSITKPLQKGFRKRNFHPLHRVNPFLQSSPACLIGINRTVSPEPPGEDGNCFNVVATFRPRSFPELMWNTSTGADLQRDRRNFPTHGNEFLNVGRYERHTF